MTNNSKLIAEHHELYLGALRSTFAAPKLGFNEGPKPFYLEVDSSRNGWREITGVDTQQVMIFVHEFGVTVTVFITSFDHGSNILSVVADEPGPCSAGTTWDESHVHEELDLVETVNASIMAAWKKTGYDDLRVKANELPDHGDWAIPR